MGCWKEVHSHHSSKMDCYYSCQAAWSWQKSGTSQRTSCHWDWLTIMEELGYAIAVGEVVGSAIEGERTIMTETVVGSVS